MAFSKGLALLMISRGHDGWVAGPTGQPRPHPSQFCLCDYHRCRDRSVIKIGVATLGAGVNHVPCVSSRQCRRRTYLSRG